MITWLYSVYLEIKDSLDFIFTTKIMQMMMTCRVHLRHAVYVRYDDLLPFQPPPLTIKKIKIMMEMRQCSQQTDYNLLETFDCKVKRIFCWSFMYIINGDYKENTSKNLYVFFWMKIGEILFGVRGPISNAQNRLLEDAKVDTLESLRGWISQIKFRPRLGSFWRWNTILKVWWSGRPFVMLVEVVRNA